MADPAPPHKLSDGSTVPVVVASASIDANPPRDDGAASERPESMDLDSKPPTDVEPHANDDDADADGDVDDAAEAEAVTRGRPRGAPIPGRLDNDMLTVVENLANYLSTWRDDDGYQIGAAFQRIPNRRLMPDYHEIIKEPTAFSTIRTKKLKKQYSAFTEFVRDVALISHNAQVYNRPSSQLFKDAIRLREIFKEELQKLIDDETITAEDAVFPDLGEIPEADDDSLEEEEQEEDEEEEEEDSESSSEDDDEDDEGTGRRGRGRRGRGAYKPSREGLPVRRGRPPKVFTPVEARILSLLKGLRRPKHPDGELLVLPFEKLPDKARNPDYYNTIANPVALDGIKTKYKRKKYQNVDQALQDLDVMFNNAKEYNIETSQLHKDAVRLQTYAHELATQEKGRPDDEFEDEDGRRSVSEIHHRGQFWRVGDWVHITNANDLAKPIIAQIYRTWQDRQGHQWVNACWYYRPEQTVHRHERHFLEHEVVKTGQYRDHRIDEVVDRCFVMFVTRFDKGRPRGLPKDKEVYVCRSRYNEENHKLNKIKTWSSCLPDEVRDKDYEMDLFDVPQSLKKIPSPIKHLLRYDAKPTDPLPKPTWGAPNAPPLVGSVHCREREANETPPPEPMLSLVKSHSESIRRTSLLQTPRPLDGSGDIIMNNAGHISALPMQQSPANSHTTPTYAPHYAQRPSATPVPVPQYGSHGYQPGHAAPPPHTVPQMQPQAAAAPYQAQQAHHQPAYTAYPAQYNNATVPITHQAHQPQHTPHQMSFDASQRMAPSPARNAAMSVPVASPSPYAQSNAYNPPRPIEVYKLDEVTNASIPDEVREQFLRDDSGHVLFFTQPPLDRPKGGISQGSANLGHSVRYLADRAREVEDRRAKRKARDSMRKEEESKRLARTEEDLPTAKQAHIDETAKLLMGWSQSIQDEADALTANYGGWRVKQSDINI